MNKQVRLGLTIFTLIFSYTIFSIVIENFFGLIQMIDLDSPITMNYGRGVDVDYDSITTFVGWYNRICSSTLAYAVYTRLKKGLLSQHEKLLVLSILIYSSIILIPAHFVDLILNKNINDNFGLLKILLEILVLGSGYLSYRNFCYHKSEIDGYKVYEFDTNYFGMDCKLFFESKSREDLMKFIQGSRYLPIPDNLTDKELQKIKLSSSRLKINEYMKCHERYIHKQYMG